MKPNLLIPDPYSTSAYAVIQCLKEFCDKIYVSVSPGILFPKISCPSAYSNSVDEVFFVENPSGDWSFSFYNKDNTEKEELFLTEIAGICRRKGINLIYPTSEPSVYLFSKNIGRFKDLGIEVPVPEYSKLIFIMDKLAITSLAEKSGIACPKTYLLNEDYFENESFPLNFPVIIKPRFGLGSAGISKCNTKKELFSKYMARIAEFNELLLQEYIPSKEMDFINVYMDRESNLVANFCYKLERPDMRVFHGRSGANELIEPQKSSVEIIGLLKSLKFQGYASAQFRVDSRSKIPKFLEINMKMTAGVWMAMRLGKNRPLFNYYVYTGKDKAPLTYNYRKGVIFLSPVEDCMIFLVYLLCWFIKHILKCCFFYGNNHFNNLPPMKEIICDYKSKYTKKDIELNLYCTNFLKDPFVSLSAWFYFFYKLVKIDFPDGFVQ